MFRRENEEKKAALKEARQAFKDSLTAKAQAAGAPPPELCSDADVPGSHFLGKAVEENGWEDFGVLVFRTHFGNEGLWEQFREM